MNKKIGVLLPVYKKDCIEFLKKSVGSILGQTSQNFHIYIGVDGPAGEEMEECLKKLDEEANITVVRFEINRGLACVLNDLIAICKK